MQEGESRYVDILAELPTREPVPSPDGRSTESWLALVHVEIEAADTVAPLRRRMFHYYEPLRHRHDLPVLPADLRIGESAALDQGTAEEYNCGRENCSMFVPT